MTPYEVSLSNQILMFGFTLYILTSLQIYNLTKGGRIDPLLLLTKIPIKTIFWLQYNVRFSFLMIILSVMLKMTGA